MSAAHDICKARQGEWHTSGRFGLMPGPNHSKRDRSVKIWAGPDGSVMVHSFAGESWKDIKADLCERGLMPEWHAPERIDPQERERRRRQAQKRQQREAVERCKRAADIEAARIIWRQGKSLAGTLGAIFLHRRGLDGPYPPSLRFVGSLEHPYTGLALPCLVAGIQGVNGHVQAVQRTYLKMDGAGKAALSRPRLAKGPITGGTVRLAAAGEVLGLAEGVETGLAAMQLFGTPTWSCLGGANIKNAPLPDITKQVIIYGDAGDAGRRFAEEAAEVFALQGRKVKLSFPVEPHGDFNDVLMDKEVVA